MQQAPRILIVEDRDALRRLLETALAQHGYDITSAADGAEGVALAKTGDFDLVVTDLKLPSASGLEVLEASRERRPEAPVLVLTAHGTVQTAVDAMKMGASDYLEKPVEIDDLTALVGSHLGGESGPTLLEAPGVPPIVGRHPLMRAAAKLTLRVAPTESTVLLTGESGTGKELFARAIHAHSPRKSSPFVAVNCAALPAQLLENELFGHEKGAFTGAHRRQKGRFEAAQGGTLLLDEIGELETGIQGKVLRVLEERAFERVGGTRTVRADVRLVAATNRDLRAMVKHGEFRSDLFFRLEVFPIELPALRERSSDIPALAGHILEQVCTRLGRTRLIPTSRAEDLLQQQPWPGNVRQLANLLERAAILCEGNTLSVADLKGLLSPGDAEARQEVEDALLASGGDKKRAAELLGISYRSLQRKVQQYDLEGFPRYRGQS
ncbi:MAG: sigma-54-dependent Fis family transcriptional regulator [bacterium]|nr:sigma-54-dependent Fis family transcriptional regulator [bacterium]